MILLVAYELKQPATSYDNLFEILKSKTSWAHYISSAWLVSTDESPKDLSQQLIPHIFDSDRIIVTEVPPGYAGWLPRKAWDWIERHRED
jgi:hypothetical protein